MIVELQRPGEKEPVFISNYSDPGIPFYGGLIKFLFIHNLKIPEPPKPDFQGYELNQTAETTGKMIGEIRFPLEYSHHPQAEESVTMKPVYRVFGKPELSIRIGHEQFFLESGTVQRLAKAIPEMRPRTAVFPILHTSFLKEAKKHLEQIARRPMGQMKFRFRRNTPPKPTTAKKRIGPKQAPRRK